MSPYLHLIVLLQMSIENNAVNGTQSIVLSDQPNRKLEIGFYSNSSQGTTWSWDIQVDFEQTTKISIVRSADSKEDLNIYLNRTGDISILKNNKDLTNWVSTTFYLTADKVHEVLFRAQLYAATTFNSFQATIEEVGEDDNALLGVLLVIGIALILSCTLWSCCWIITTHWRMKYQQRAEIQRERIRIQRLHEIRYLRVDDVMNNMKKGEYHELKTKYSQDSWVICLEDYLPDSKIHITNECLHVFHSSCLKEWYSSIDQTKDLACPHCNTTNTKDSTPKQEPSIDSVQNVKNEESKNIYEDSKYEDSKNMNTQFMMLENQINMSESMTRTINIKPENIK